MKSIQGRISERYPNHSQLEWDVLNGIVAIAKEYAREVAYSTLVKAQNEAINVIEDTPLATYPLQLSKALKRVTSTEIITP